MLKRGFTLIELLVVVAIIALLVSILMPALGQARNQTKTAVCAARLYQIGIALYSYTAEWNGRVPYVITPMTNGVGNPPHSPYNVPGFGNQRWSDADLDPFSRDRWPDSLPNVLMPQYIGSTAELFICPAARIGWPRQGGALRYTYREAAANQPRGVVNRPEIDVYLSEHFGLLDGRMYKRFRLELSGDVIKDAEQMAFMGATYLRDMVVRDGQELIGPHRGGNNVLNRDLQVEFRSQSTINQELNPNSTGVEF